MISTTAHSRLRLLFGSLLALAALAGPSRADLMEYVQKEDPTYQYEIRKELDFPQARGFLVHMISQNWRGLTWSHWILLVSPKKQRHENAATLILSGGRNGPAPRISSERTFYITALAERLGCPFAMLFQIPNQPILGDRSEDELIAYTFDKFLKTGETDWPLLLPMTKSVIRAMDCIQEILLQKTERKITRFCVTGGSKRGWTTWLTAACDPRVVAIAPLAIDTLNMSRQLSHQLDAWGSFSKQIADYTQIDLPGRMKKDPRGQALLQLVDPYTYRERVQIPKMIFVGTNDRYWPLDSASLYFRDLKGPSFLHYVPNAGHSLSQAVIPHVCSFFDRVLNLRPLPQIQTSFALDERSATVTTVSSVQPLRVELWQAYSDTRDFRDSRWTSRPVTPSAAGAFVAHLPRPRKPGTHLAFYLQLHLREGSGTLGFSSPVKLLPAPAQPDSSSQSPR